MICYFIAFEVNLWYFQRLSVDMESDLIRHLYVFTIYSANAVKDSSMLSSLDCTIINDNKKLCPIISKKLGRKFQKIFLNV